MIDHNVSCLDHTSDDNALIYNWGIHNDKLALNNNFTFFFKWIESVGTTVHKQGQKKLQDIMYSTDLHWVHNIATVLILIHTEVTNSMPPVYTTQDYEYRHKNKGTDLVLVPRKFGVYKWDHQSYKILCTVTVLIYIEYAQNAHAPSHTQKPHTFSCSFILFPSITVFIQLTNLGWDY